MKVIYKYDLPIKHGTFLFCDLPMNSRILSVGCQDNLRAVMWVLQEKNCSEIERRIILCMFTGAEMDMLDLDKFLGTVSFDNGGFICHYFEVT